MRKTTMNAWGKQREPNLQAVWSLFLSTLSILLLLLSHPAQGEVNHHTGQLSLAETDISLPAGAITLELRRSLLPQSEASGLLGARWRINWEKRLIHNGESAVLEELPTVTPFLWDPARLALVSADGQRIIQQDNGSWVRHGRDGSGETYDPQGRLVERDLNNGNRATLVYGADGRLSRVEGPAGRFLRFTIDSAGKLIRAEASNGVGILYEYSGDRLSQVRLEGGPTVRYRYNGDGFLTEIVSPGERATVYGYDLQGRVVSRRLVDGSEERWEYNDQRRLQRYTDLSGGITTTRWSDDRRREQTKGPLGRTSVTEYNELGRPVSLTGPTGAVARIGYDTLGRIVSVSDPAGLSTRFEYLGDSDLVKAVIRHDDSRLEYAYDEQRNLTALQLGGRQLLGYSYTRDGLITAMEGVGIPRQTFSYHPDGQLESIADPLGGTTSFEYSERGNLVRETNPLGGATLRRYDAQNRVISETDPIGAEIRYQYDSQGRLLSQIGPGELVRRYAYDSLGRLMEESDPGGRVTHYGYDSGGRLQSVTGPDNQIASYAYDRADNLTGFTDSQGEITRYEYDLLGRISRELHSNGLKVRYGYDPVGNLIARSDSSGAANVYRYDALGELVQVTDAVGARTRYRYGPLRNLKELIDPAGRRKVFDYTADGQVARVREPSGDEVRYTYDEAGRLAAVQRPSGGISRYDYDAMGNLVSEMDPLGNWRHHDYDLAGRPIANEDALGRVSQTRYDKPGRIVERERPDGTRIHYRYDRTGNLMAIDDGSFPIRYGYDASGRQTRSEYPAIDQALTYQYSSKGARSRLLLPDDQAIGYEYNGFGQLSALVLPTGGKIRFSYDLAGRQKSVHYPNGITGHYDYDGEGRTTEIRYQDQQGKIIGGNEYRLDTLGNMLERRDAAGASIRYAYDAAGQLVEESRPQTTIRYHYGPGGNRAELQRDGVTTRYRHDEADQLVQAGAETLAYDANGNLVSRRGAGDWRYRYDSENQLVGTSGPDGVDVSYGYDATGTRIWREDAGGRIWFLYDGLDLVQVLDANLNTRATYVHAPGIDRPLAMLHEGRVYYYHADRLGSIRELTDGRGRVVAAYDYDAFGNINVLKEFAENPFTYTAREWDSVTGLFYYRARYYDPEIGRFISSDPLPAPILEPLEQNPYLYAANNPIRFTDPLGLSLIDDFKAGKWTREVQLFIEHGRTLEEQQLFREKFERNRAKHARTSRGPKGTGSGPKARPSGRAPGARARPGPSPGRPSVNTPRPGGKVSPGRGALRGAGLGSAIGLGIEGIHYWACIDEGYSRSECLSQAGKRFVIAAVVGAGAGFVIASTGGTAAPVIIAVLSGAGAAAGGAQAGNRWAQAPESRAQREQNAAQQAQSRRRLDNVLANLDAQIAALKESVKKIDEAKKKANNSINPIERMFQELKNDLQMAAEPIKPAILQRFKNECSAVKTRLQEAKQCVDGVRNKTKEAQKKLNEALALLEACPLPGPGAAAASPVDSADDLLAQARNKLASLPGDCKIDKLPADIQAVKDSVAGLRATVNHINDLRNALLKWKFADKSERRKLLRELVSNPYGQKAFLLYSSLLLAKEPIEAVKPLSRRFEEDKKSLLEKTIPNLRSFWPPKSINELESRKSQIENLEPSNQTDPDRYLKRLEKADMVGLLPLLPMFQIKAWQLDDCDGVTANAVQQAWIKAKQVVNAAKPDTKRQQEITAKRAACQAKLIRHQQATPKLEKLVISPAQVVCVVGQRCPPLKLLGIYSNGTQVDLTRNPNVTWSTPPIINARAPSPPFPVTATFSGKTARATVSVKPGAPAATTTQQPPPTTPQHPAGGVEVVGWGVIEPKTKSMTLGGADPTFTFQFAYIDYGDPRLPGSSSDKLPAVCQKAKATIGRQRVRCGARDPNPLSSSYNKPFFGHAWVIVKKDDKKPGSAGQALAAGCPPDRWSLECELALGSPTNKPTEEQLARIRGLSQTMQGTQGPPGKEPKQGSETMVTRIPGSYTTPGTAQMPSAQPGGGTPPPTTGGPGQQKGGDDPWESFIEPRFGTPTPGTPPAGHIAKRPTIQPPPQSPAQHMGAPNQASTPASSGCTSFSDCGPLKGTFYGKCKGCSGYENGANFSATIFSNGDLRGSYENRSDKGRMVGSVTPGGKLEADFKDLWDDCRIWGTVSHAGTKLTGSGKLHCTGCDGCDGTWWTDK